MGKKKILGLDIGTTSIAFSMVDVTDKKNKDKYSNSEPVTDINNDRIGLSRDENGKPIIGVRIISQETDRFDRGLKLNDPKGNTLTPTATRRKFRTIRRLKNRYKLRRNKLFKLFSLLGLRPDANYYTNKKGKRGKGNDIGLAMYELRDRAAKSPITLEELCRVLLHLNQLRGYSSDRFSKDDEPKFDYFTTEVVSLDLPGKQPVYDKKNPKEIICYQIKIKLRFIEPYVEIKNDHKNVFEYIEGYIFKKDIAFKERDIITIKAPEYKQNKKGKSVFEEYYKITPTNPDPTDWQYKYQTLHKNLTDWHKDGGTVGSFFYKYFYEVKTLSRVRNNVVNREWYEKEFDTIWNLQYHIHKGFFDQFNVEDLSKQVFKDYIQVLNDIEKKENNREKFRALIKDKIIFFQRPWQQAKNKKRCEFEKINVVKSYTIKGTGTTEKKAEHIGRPVAPRSHPLFQQFKLWQQINNVKLFYNTGGEKFNLFESEAQFLKHTGRTIAQVKNLLYNKLQISKSLSWRIFVKEELKIETYDEIKDIKPSVKTTIDKDTGELVEAFYSVNYRKRKPDGTFDDIKLKGNTTKVEIKNILVSNTDDWFESTHEENKSITNIELLWSIIYDITIPDPKKASIIIKRHFGFDDDTCLSLANIKFDDLGMANLSAKAIRNLIPLMSTGENLTRKTEQKITDILRLNEVNFENTDHLESLKIFIPDRKSRIRLSKLVRKEDFRYLNYWEAAAIVYGSHSSRNISSKNIIERVHHNSMNNHIVEKIVNETISIVNELHNKYKFDEVRIELSRELRSSAYERQKMWESIASNTARNDWAKRMLRGIKSALIESDRDISQLDTELSGNNLDKIKIMEDVVKYQKESEYKNKTKEYKSTEPSSAEVTKYILWLEQNFKCPYTNQPIPLTDIFGRGNVVEIEHIIPRERYYSNAYSNKVITWREINQLKESHGNRTAYEFIVKKRINNTVKVGNREFELVAANQWEDHVKAMFPKGAKRNNLLRKEIPEDPIERTLKETQYINKKLKEKLGELLGAEKVWVTSGAVTDILREKWKLNDVWKQLVEDRFINFNIGESKKRLNLKYVTKQFNAKKNEEINVEKYAGMSKRIDHRHHALDAIIIACTKQNHIQYINNLNSINSEYGIDDYSIKKKYKTLKDDICLGNSSTKFKFPWDENKFLPDVKEALFDTLISHKNANVLISPSNNRTTRGIKLNKSASIRGELHLQTNYARKRYFENEKLEIDKLIPLLFKKMFDNQNQSMVRFKSFEKIIKETVLKEKYQNCLMQLLAEYDGEKLTKSSCKEYSKMILTKIKDGNLLTHSRSKEPITWLSIYSDKSAAVRPMGLIMDINSEKEIKDIANLRLRRIANYRLKYINEQIEIIRKQKLFKDEENSLIREIKDINLYSNAIYEVRIRVNENQFEWVELINLQESDIDRIEYANPQTTSAVKAKLSELPFDELKKNYIKKPIFLSDNPITVKKARQKSYFQDLYELNDGRNVVSRDVFMSYLFIPKESNRKDTKREIEFLKFFDAVKIVTDEKPDKIDYSKLITKPGYKLLFTLSKNDIVYLPDEALTDEQLEEIDWDNRKDIITKLYIVKDMNPSRNEIIFQHLYKSDSIRISEEEASELFNIPGMKKLEEEIKYGDTNMWKRCIKVYVDKLCRTITPYWLFQFALK